MSTQREDVAVSGQSVMAATGQVLLAAHSRLSNAAARQGEQPGSQVRSCQSGSLPAGLSDAGTHRRRPSHISSHNRLGTPAHSPTREPPRSAAWFGTIRDSLDVRKRSARPLEGLPLTIELAAGRLRSVSFVDLAGRLADGLRC
jgi:hypothetical protein